MESLKKISSNSIILFILVLAGTSIALLAWLYPTNTEVKSMNFGLLSYVERINLDGVGDTEKIKVFFEETEISNLTYAKFRFVNSGTQPISPEDYVEALQIFFPESILILKFDITPSQIMSGSIYKNNIIVLDKKLLNPSEYFDVEVTASGVFKPSDVKIIGRVVGVSDYPYVEFGNEALMTAEEKKSEARKALIQLIKTILIMVVVMLATITGLKILTKYKYGENILLITIFIGMVIPMLGYLSYEFIKLIRNAFFI